MLNYYSEAHAEPTYRITIEGHTWTLNETNTQKVIDLINSLTHKAPVTSKLHNPAPKQSSSKKSSSKFPSLGTPDDIKDLGVVTRYGNLFRYWENGYTTDKQKAGLRYALKNAGATWNDEKGAFEFKTKKEADAFTKAQQKYNKEYEAKKNSK